MSKEKRLRIKIDYVQLLERTSQGMTAIGQPIKPKLANKIRKELFGDNPNIIALPSVSPQKKKLKKVM